MSSSLFALASISLILSSTLAQTFHLKDKFIGHDFLSGFNWETFDDPSGGFVNYVDQATALSRNLSFVSGNTFVIRADDQNVVPPSSRGRDSVRITSHNAYADSVIILDMKHMPEGCGTWPAFWTMSQVGPWPNGGELDIMEGINLNTQNSVSLHTTEGCTMPQKRQQKGTAETTDCNTFVNGNSGCGSKFTGSGTFGSSFNSASGGWFVMTRSNQMGIAIYFWSRNDQSVPKEIKNPGQSITPSTSWGLPQARFPTDSCDMSKHLDAHQIIINLTLCGHWAGKLFTDSGCGAGPCNDYVANNPSAFTNAYFDIKALRVYAP